MTQQAGRGCKTKHALRHDVTAKIVNVLSQRRLSPYKFELLLGMLMVGLLWLGVNIVSEK